MIIPTTGNDNTKTIDTIMQYCNDTVVEQQLTDHLQQHNFITKKHDDMSKTAIKKSKTKKEVYERAIERIIALLEKGEVAWRRTWGTYGLAKNFKTDHVYTGVNFLFMNYLSEFPIPYYLTYRQAKELGGNVKKGEKAQEYVYFYTGYYKDENGKNVSETDANLPRYANIKLTPVRFLKCYPVFNIEQCEGIEWERPEVVKRPNTTIQECEAIINEMNPQPTFKLVDANRAFYAPEQDIVNVPNIKQYINSESYYSVLWHELVHWTGHSTRLNREGIVNSQATKGSDLYSEEELIAELGANFISNIVGIATDQTQENTAGYLQSWIKRLREDPKILFRVAPKAQAATEYILGRSLKEITL